MALLLWPLLSGKTTFVMLLTGSRTTGSIPGTPIRGRRRAVS